MAWPGPPVQTWPSHSAETHCRRPFISFSSKTRPKKWAAQERQGGGRSKKVAGPLRRYLGERGCDRCRAAASGALLIPTKTRADPQRVICPTTAATVAATDQDVSGGASGALTECGAAGLGRAGTAVLTPPQLPCTVNNGAAFSHRMGRLHGPRGKDAAVSAAARHAYSQRPQTLPQVNSHPACLLDGN